MEEHLDFAEHIQEGYKTKGDFTLIGAALLDYKFYPKHK